MKVSRSILIITSVLLVMESSSASNLTINELIPSAVGYLASGDDECGLTLAPKMEDDGYREALYSELGSIAEDHISDDEFDAAMDLFKRYAYAKATNRPDIQRAVLEQAREMSISKINSIQDSKKLFDSLDLPVECKNKVINALEVEYNKETLRWEKRLLKRDAA